MGLTNFPGGISSFGIPVIPGAPRVFTGTAYFVCNASGYNGSDNNNGLRPDQPLSTLAKALTLVTSNNDDVIFVMKGHAETLGAAAAVACASSGFSIIGLGNGRLRPVFTWATLTSATWTIAGSNVFIQNCVFIGTGIDAVVTMFAVTGDDVAFDSCEFDHANATNQASLGITVTGTDRFVFTNNRVHGTLNAGTTNFLQIVGAASKQNDYYIAGNSFVGAYTSSLGAINNITTAVVNMVVRDNLFINLTASATKNIVLLTGSTGVISKNSFGQGSGNAPITGDATWRLGNATVAAAATDGTGFI